MTRKSAGHQPNRRSCAVVSDMVYLGALIDNSGSCELEIQRRIQLARTATTQLSKIWCDRNKTNKN